MRTGSRASLRNAAPICRYPVPSSRSTVPPSGYLLMLKFLSSACQGCIKSCAFIWKAGKESTDGNDSDKRKRMNKTSEELGIIVDTGIKFVLVLLCFALLAHPGAVAAAATVLKGIFS